MSRAGMIIEFGTLRSECVLNASEGVSTRNGIGVLGGIPQFRTNSIPGKFELACNKWACVLVNWS